MSLVVVDYGAGNLTSVANALAYIGERPSISKNPEEIAKASKLIFPGVGAASAAMDNLKTSGIGDAIAEVVRKGNFVLGICIGTQIILDSSEEDGGTQTLGLIPGKAIRFKEETGIKIPHMGWNQVHFSKEHPLFKGIQNDSDFYFVHSFYPQVKALYTIAETTYGTQTFASAVCKENLMATQFHLEKSGDKGLQVLKNFCDL